ncbi:MAG: helix-turn-helix transcriptional regulator [Calditrichaeota bacterium]|nr:helix-turn-helix transcriptional regulator [Calditrichota bacterium]
MVNMLTDIVLTVTGFQLVSLAVVLAAQKNGRLTPRLLLMAFLLTKALLIARWFVFRFGMVQHTEPDYLFRLSKAGFFLLAPLLFLYVRSLCYKDFRFTTKTSLHFVPFFVVLLCTLAALRSSNAGGAVTWYDRLFVSRFYDAFWGLNLVQILGYIAAMLHTVRRYRQRIRSVYSTVHQIDLTWLLSLLALISLHWLFVASRAVLTVVGIPEGNLTGIIDLYSITIFLVFTTILVFRGTAQLKLFAGVEEKPKYSAYRLSEAQMAQHAERLRRYMESEKPYLCSSLTIDRLSQMLSIPRWHLSQVINEVFHQNFFTFVNSYRVEEAKRYLAGGNPRLKTVSEVLYEVGFNSKSVFNEVFRKHTGLTPTQYRRLHSLHASARQGQPSHLPSAKAT